jgi:beta-glucosidase
VRRPLRGRSRVRRPSRLLAAGLVLLASLLGLAAAQGSTPAYLDAGRDVEARVADLLARMTLEEKVGQMTLLEKGSVTPAEATRLALGGVLSGGGGYPTGDNSVSGWAAMVGAYQDAALATRLGIPLLYGVDAVHGHANLAGAVVFPHNVGLGAAGDAELVEAIARVTAREMIATGIYWNYAPVLAVPRDVRWGRTYEGYGEDPALVTRLATAALRGLQGDDLAAPDTVLATPKHFVGDGATAFGTSPLADGLLDRGDAEIDEATLRRVHLAPYLDALANGARSVMVSFSSWQGVPMHAHAYLIRDVLRGELGFTGFVVSDWAGVDAVAPSYDDAVVAAVNAGIDMVMVPYDGERFIAAVLDAVARGDIGRDRIDEAAAAILRVKFELGLFERPHAEPTLQSTVGSATHRALAREAVGQTLVLLKNEHGALPLRPDGTQTVLVTGSGADSVGVQSGGWTIEWQGSTASLTPGTTVLEGLEAGFGPDTTLLHGPRGRFTGADGQPLRAEVGIAVVGEPPYAEWFGDSADLVLPSRERALVANLRAQVDTLIVVLLTGRPVVLDGVLEVADAVVAAWLPGTEGDGVTDVLFGERDFVGRLPYSWPRDAAQLPFDFDDLPTEGCEAPLFPRGYGLSYADDPAATPWLTLAAACADGDAAGAADHAGAPAPFVALPDPDGPALVDPALLREHRPREAVFVPFPVPIVLDGDLADWNGIPFEIVDAGPMVSLDPAENGHFQFALAADEAHVYLYMVMPDATIVTGQHGTDFWNEDSLEFYLNLSDDLMRGGYGEGVFQVNVNPTNVGNADPADLVLTGVNAGQAGVRAFVFETADGWGFEAAVPIPAGVDLRHGLEVGLQAHANGSSGGARDVKLIWSAADTRDTSWQDPSVFGRAVFYELGNPAPLSVSERTEPVVVAPRPQVAINQLGYLPGAPHFGMLANHGAFATSWALIDDATGRMVYAGSTGPPLVDAASGDSIQVADFTGFDVPGIYRLLINDVLSSPFTIGELPYTRLAVDAARYFFLSRSGIELLPAYAGPDHARPAGHLSDDAVTCYRGTDADGVTWPGCDYTLDVAGGWYDAGDYGKYVVNGGISVWTLLNLHERLPGAFPDGSLGLPESGNGVSDLLDEARWQMAWLLSMQVPEGQPQAGMAHHKLHDLAWEGLPLLPPTVYDNDPTSAGDGGRYLYPPSTAATLNLAATAAQCARVWRDVDAAFAERCRLAAERAFRAAVEEPVALAGNTPGTGGGNYDDDRITDERFWAAAELYLATGDPAYVDAMRATPYLASFGGSGGDAAMYWGDTAALGALSLILHDADLDEVAALREQLLRTADGYLQVIATEGYRVPIRTYPWGSNSAVLNNAIVLAYAHDLTGDAAYLHGVLESMDYLLGRNALAFSFVSGYGERSMTNPHHRFWAHEGDWPPPPPGVVAGGPNATPSDPTALDHATLDAGPARRYVDLRGSWSTNEVTINWNAPLVWVATYLAQTSAAPGPQGAAPTDPPTHPEGSRP